MDSIGFGVCIIQLRSYAHFWIKNIHHDNTCISLEEGDLIIYKGKELEHWREKYNGKEQIQVFLLFKFNTLLINYI